MKIPINKISVWQNPKNCLPSPDKLIIVQDNNDEHLFRLGSLDVDDGKLYILFNSDSDGGCEIEEVKRWAYIKLDF